MLNFQEFNTLDMYPNCVTGRIGLGEGGHLWNAAKAYYCSRGKGIFAGC